MNEPPVQPTLTLMLYMRAAHGKGVPIGTVLPFAKEPPPSEWIAPEGQQFMIADWPALFEAIGHNYSMVPAPETRWQRIWRWVTRKPAPMMIEDPTRFRVPDLRGKWKQGEGGNA